MQQLCFWRADTAPITPVLAHDDPNSTDARFLQICTAILSLTICHAGRHFCAVILRVCRRYSVDFYNILLHTSAGESSLLLSQDGASELPLSVSSYMVRPTSKYSALPMIVPLISLVACASNCSQVLQMLALPIECLAALCMGWRSAPAS